MKLMLRPGEEMIMAWKGGHKELCVEPKWELVRWVGIQLARLRERFYGQARVSIIKFQKPS